MRHQPRKRFGQNFLRDEGVIDSIERAIAPKHGDHVVEIGPGEGALTRAILASGCQLDAIELDRNLITGLLAAFSIHSGFTLHSADALKFDFSSIATPGRGLRVVGNLPYNISTPLIMKLLAQKSLLEDMHFMLQKEVVNRLAAGPGSKNYGRLSVMAQYYCHVIPVLNVPPGAFKPPPKVDSAVVKLVPHQTPPVDVESVNTLERVCAQAFNQRRKTIRNSLKDSLSEEEIRELGIDPTSRAEVLSLNDFATIANAVSAKEHQQEQ